MPQSSQYPSASERTRTPPEVKWLLAEHAALTGREAQLRRHLSELDTELKAVTASRKALQAVASLLDERLDLTVVEPVVAWQGRYGRRGALQEFLLDTLRKAMPQGLTTNVLTSLAIARFDLGPMSGREKCAYQDSSIRPQLRQFKARGRATSSPESGGIGRSTVWRWKPPGCALSDLVAASLAAE